MKWNTWPYWLRGGVIGGGVVLVWGLSIYACNWFVGGENFICLPLLFFSPLLPVASLLDYLYSTYTFSFPFDFLVIGIIVWFAVGVLIGVTVRYLKSKKKSIFFS
jgi:hypothetical protein